MLFLRQLKSVAGDKMRIRPKRHHKTTANPVKSLQQRNDVRTDTEVKSIFVTHNACDITVSSSTYTWDAPQ